MKEPHKSKLLPLVDKSSFSSRASLSIFLICIPLEGFQIRTEPKSSSLPPLNAFHSSCEIFLFLFLSNRGKTFVSQTTTRRASDEHKIMYTIRQSRAQNPIIRTREEKNFSH